MKNQSEQREALFLVPAIRSGILPGVVERIIQCLGGLCKLSRALIQIGQFQQRQGQEPAGGG